MEKIIIEGFEAFKAFEGKNIGYSDYHTVDQKQINLFADATLDHQWIHTDEKRAKEETPFKSTIAHGYLTLSLLPFLWEQTVEVRNYKMLVNYGIENLKFINPVKVNSRLRLKVDLKSIVNLRGISKTTLHTVIEIEGERKPALDAEIVFLYHFNS